MPRYRVLVDDNFHYQDENERYEHGTYDTMEEALAICHAIVQQWLLNEYKPGMSALSLYNHYADFGDDPFIVSVEGADVRANFSAWTYAKERSEAICAKG